MNEKILSKTTFKEIEQSKFITYLSSYTGNSLVTFESDGVVFYAIKGGNIIGKKDTNNKTYFTAS